MAIIKVKTGGITADAITSTEIADNAVVTAAINADAVTDAKIADDVVGTEHLTANEVDTAALGADAVTGAQLADNAVNSEHYTDGSIDTAHIADAQITTAKLATAVFTGATDIGAAIVDADLFLMDDGAGGTIRKTTASRIKTYAGGANTPAFFAHSASEQALSNATYTQVVFGTEVLDTDNAFASNTFTVPSGKGGNYMIGANLEFSAGANYVNGWIVNIYVDGSGYYKHNNEYEANYPAKANAPINAVIPLTAGQTVKIYAYFSYTGSAGKIFHELKTTNFYGFKLL